MDKIKNPYVESAENLSDAGHEALPGVKSKDTISRALNSQMPAGNVPAKPLKKHAYLAFFNKLAADMGMALPSESSVQPTTLPVVKSSFVSAKPNKIPSVNQFNSYRNPGGTAQTAKNIGIGKV
jgi:hypothetical protein